MEVAQYGDTEIHASELKTIVEKLKRSDSGKCKMEDDYEVRHKISSNIW